MKVALPSWLRMSMKPPPPRLPAAGCTTARAKPVATAASTALPPCSRMLTPGIGGEVMHADHHPVAGADGLFAAVGERAWRCFPVPTDGAAEKTKSSGRAGQPGRGRKAVDS